MYDERIKQFNDYTLKRKMLGLKEELRVSINSAGQITLDNYLIDKKDIIINGFINTIGIWAFNCKEDTESIILSEGVEKMFRGSFTGCRAIKMIDIPNSLIDIPEYGFLFDCIQLDTIKVHSECMYRKLVTDYGKRVKMCD